MLLFFTRTVNITFPTGLDRYLRFWDTESRQLLSAVCYQPANKMISLCLTPYQDLSDLIIIFNLAKSANHKVLGGRMCA